jgi:hypothetical protein
VFLGPEITYKRGGPLIRSASLSIGWRLRIFRGFLGKQHQQRSVPNLIARLTALTLGDKLSIKGDVFVMDEKLHHFGLPSGQPRIKRIIDRMRPPCVSFIAHLRQFIILAIVTAGIRAAPATAVTWGAGALRFHLLGLPFSDALIRS